MDAACNDWTQATDQYFRDAPGGANTPDAKGKAKHKAKRTKLTHPATAFAAVANLPAAPSRAHQHPIVSGRKKLSRMQFGVCSLKTG